MATAIEEGRLERLLRHSTNWVLLLGEHDSLLGTCGRVGLGHSPPILPR